MNEILSSVFSGVAAFAATNIDDLFLLMLYFSRANNDPRREREIILGQYLGFSVLVFISVLGYAGSLLFPRQYVGLLGFLPIVLGIRELLELRKGEDKEETIVEENANGRQNTRHGIWDSSLLRWVNPQVGSIAAVTIANGSDNIAVYSPLFAAGDASSMLIIIGVFLVMVRVWCWVADFLAENPVTAGPLRRYGRLLMPFVLIGIGLLILVESEAIQLFIPS
jgi:cadmium resistance transport/sequestration family protein